MLVIKVHNENWNDQEKSLEIFQSASVTISINLSKRSRTSCLKYLAEETEASRLMNSHWVKVNLFRMITFCRRNEKQTKFFPRAFGRIVLSRAYRVGIEYFISLEFFQRLTKIAIDATRLHYKCTSEPWTWGGNKVFLGTWKILFSFEQEPTDCTQLGIAHRFISIGLVF